MYGLGWPMAIIAIGLLIIVHEAGHYFVAKWCKMRVDRFSLGFGPGVWGWKRNGTLFQIAPIPFGGFVEIRGMNIAEEVDPDDEFAYPNRPAWQRFATIFAGPLTNYLFAIFLAFILFVTAGVPTGTSWYQVNHVDPGFDAAGKLELGDRIISIQRDGDPQPIYIYDKYQGEIPDESLSLSKLIHETKGQPFSITVLRGGDDGKQLTFQLMAKEDPEREWPPGSKSGEKQFRVGLGFESHRERVDVGVLGAGGYALYFPVLQTKNTLIGLYRIITGEERDGLAGPVGIAVVIKQAIESSWILLLELLIIINVSLGLFNLLPLPALDGGRLVFLLYEMTTRRRPNPKFEATVHMVGILFLILLMVAVTYKDCLRVL